MKGDNVKIGCIAQARMTSKRLPGKVLKTLNFDSGATILDEVIIRLKRSERIDEIIIATTINTTDDEIIFAANGQGAGSFRGSEDDVLERYYLAAKENALDVIVRVTCDCPFIDPGVIDELVDFYERGGFDYASNCIKRTYPHGLDCEIFSFNVLEKIYLKAREPFYREHVTSYIYTHEGEFSLGSMELPSGEDYSDMRITVDTKQDYVLACLIRDYLSDKPNPSFRDIIDIFDRKPYLHMINEDIRQKMAFESQGEELAEAVKVLRLQELNSAAEILLKKIEEPD